MKLIKKFKKHKVYQNNLFDNDNANKNFWKYIKHLRKDNTGVPPLNKDNQTITEPKEKANLLNKHFDSIFTNEDLSNIPECNHSTYPNVPSIVFTTNGIHRQLSSLNVNKASGPDSIPGCILQICATEVAPILMVLFTQSLNTGEVPSDWLNANVIPVYKKGNKHDPSNYRPISLTSICCKVMEHVLCHVIMKHLEENHILNDFQYGFRPAHSCETQLISLVEEIYRSLDLHY